MTIKQHVRYEVLSEPSPEYHRGVETGRNGIYTVVKLVDDLPPEIIKVFDSYPSSQSRQDAYAHAAELNERRRQEVALAVLVPFVEDLKAISIADATELDRLREENVELKKQVANLEDKLQTIADWFHSRPMSASLTLAFTSVPRGWWLEGEPLLSTLCDIDSPDDED